MDHENFYLLNKLMNGTLTHEERVLLKVWINSSQDEEVIYHIYSLWNNFDPDNAVFKLETETIYKEVKNEINRKTRFYYVRRIQQIASVLLFLVSVFIFIHTYNLHPRINEEGKQSMTIRTNPGERVELTLFDGTTVNLNANSAISYSKCYGEKERITELSGEAFFNVMKDAEKPFIVHTPDIKIEVLGTSFNICAYPDDEKTELAIRSGSVKVTIALLPEESLVIKANEKFVFNRNRVTWEIVELDSHAEPAWLKGWLGFRSTKLKDVMRKLENTYNVTIHLNNEEIGDDLFTGSFHCKQISEVLQILKEHYLFEYEIQENQIYIK